jgi:hypothetical protein
MLGAQSLGGDSQSMISMEARAPFSSIGLANLESQLGFCRQDQLWPLQTFSAPAPVLMSELSGSWRLLRLKRRKFIEESRSERIARSLAAVNAPQPTQLSASEWQRVVEADVEDQY